MCREMGIWFEGSRRLIREASLYHREEGKRQWGPGKGEQVVDEGRLLCSELPVDCAN
jgi:hypothetical protein